MEPKDSGSWKIVDPTIVKRAKHKYVLCRCDCGFETLVAVFRLVHDTTTRCQKCYLKTLAREGNPSFRHGMAGTPIYKLWAGMISRCTNPKVRIYKYYGGRGIAVCNRWLTFENFYEDMGERPKGLQLDRVDNDMPYHPRNCRWVTAKENNPENKGTILDDMPGRTFGKWLVMHRVVHAPGHKYYLCRCECGGHAVRSGGELRRGKAKKCGQCPRN